MAARSLFPLLIAASVMASAWLTAHQFFANPINAVENFIPPLATAKTIQVTVVLWSRGARSNLPLIQNAIFTYSIERPDKFRVDSKHSRSIPETYYISDGKTMTIYDGTQLQTEKFPRPAWEAWPFPVSMLMYTPGSVSAVPVVRAGESVLLVVSHTQSDTEEAWYDPKTHLLMRDSGLVTRKSKTVEIDRIEYTRWKLNEPIPPDVFTVPSAWVNHK